MRRFPFCPLEPREPNELVEWDITGPLTDADGTKWYIVTMLDLLTKWAEAKATTDTRGPELARILRDEWFFRYGAPK